MGRRLVRSHPVVGWGTLVAALCLGGLSLVSFRGAQADGATARAADEVRLTRARSTLEVSGLEVVALRMLAAVDQSPSLSGSLDEAGGRLEAAADEIEDIAAGSGPVAREARELLDEAYAEPFDDPVDADIDQLFYVAHSASRLAGRGLRVDSQLDAIWQLSIVRSLPHQVLIEAIAADTSVHELSIDPSMSEFFKTITETVRADGGWFASDTSAPLDDSQWIEITDAQEVIPEHSENVHALVAASPLVEYDAWTRNLGGGVEEPPAALADVVEMATELEADVGTVLDELFDDELEAVERTGGASPVPTRVLAAALAVLSVLGLVLGIRLIGASIRAARQRAVMASTDALTGVGNRHQLDDRCRIHTRDRRFDHHVVAMVDLDRFKMVNDAHGHVVGDRVLVDVARALQRVAGVMTEDRDPAEWSVVRLGGDEFLVTIHAAGQIDVGRLRALLDDVRTSTIDADGRQIVLEFSVGIAEAGTSADLGDLMPAADLAVYRDKANRRTLQPGSKASLPDGGFLRRFGP